MRKILQYPDERLKQPCEKVTKFDGRLKDLVLEMNKIMSREKGAGLAANQIGINKQVCLVSGGREFPKTLVLVNPKILILEGEKESIEGCLSLPGRAFKVKRASSVVVDFQDLQGKYNRVKMEGMLAICVQHELDHLLLGKTLADVGEEILPEQA